MPVPDGGVYEDLAGEHAAGAVKTDECGDERADAYEEMQRVGDRDEVEEFAAGVGAEEDVLGGELAPGHPLAGEEDEAEYEGDGEPKGGTAGGGAAEADPLVHDVVLVEHGAAGELGGDGAEEEDGGVEPENGRDGGGEPFVDVARVGVDVAGGLGDEEGADDGDEEHEHGEEGEEDADADLRQALPRAALALWTVVPVVAFTVAAGSLVYGWTAAVAVVAFANLFAAFAGFDLRWCEDGRHGRVRLRGGYDPAAVRLLRWRCWRRAGLPLWREVNAVVEVVAGAAVGGEEVGRRPLHGGGGPWVFG